MHLINILSFALLAAANPLVESSLEPRVACCDVRCYKRMEYADSHDLGNAKRDCKSFQRATVTPCPLTKTVTGRSSTATVTVTAGVDGNRAVAPRAAAVFQGKKVKAAAFHAHPERFQGKVLKAPGFQARSEVDAEAEIEARAAAAPRCTPTVSRHRQPSYVDGYCSGNDFKKACSCLGPKPTTVTKARATVTKTKAGRTTTVTKTITPTITGTSTTSTSTTSSTTTSTSDGPAPTTTCSANQESYCGETCFCGTEASPSDDNSALCFGTLYCPSTASDETPACTTNDDCVAQNAGTTCVYDQYSLCPGGRACATLDDCPANVPTTRRKRGLAVGGSFARR